MMRKPSNQHESNSNVWWRRFFVSTTLSFSAGAIFVIADFHDWSSTLIVVAGILVVIAIGESPEFMASTKTKKHSKIARPPGTSILNVAEFIAPKKFFERVCVEAIGDMREEYFEALSQNRIWKARWVRIRGTYSFFAAIGLDRAFAFVTFFIKAWKSVN